MGVVSNWGNPLKLQRYEVETPWEIGGEVVCLGSFSLRGGTQLGDGGVSREDTAGAGAIRKICLLWWMGTLNSHSTLLISSHVGDLLLDSQHWDKRHPGVFWSGAMLVFIGRHQASRFPIFFRGLIGWSSLETGSILFHIPAFLSGQLLRNYLKMHVNISNIKVLFIIFLNENKNKNKNKVSFFYVTS